jgi:hypothetical protein
MDDRRKETRKKVMAFTLVREAARGGLLGYLGDLTLQGAKVIGEKPLELGAQISLSIDLPGDLPGISARRMILPAQVARCVPAEGSPREFDLGFQFTPLTAEQTAILEALLERYHFRHQSEA